MQEKVTITTARGVTDSWRDTSWNTTKARYIVIRGKNYDAGKDATESSHWAETRAWDGQKWDLEGTLFKLFRL